MAPLEGLSSLQVAAVVLTGVLTFGGAAGLLFDAARRVRFRRRARESFERVDATVVDSAVHEPALGGTEAVPHVEYEYEVDGERYVSRSLWPTRPRSPGTVEHRVARRIVEDHPVDAEVIARYDPADPGRAYLLEQFDGTGERVELVVGVALLFGFVALLVVVAG
jgi:hypothetical protein